MSAQITPAGDQFQRVSLQDLAVTAFKNIVEGAFEKGKWTSMEDELTRAFVKYMRDLAANDALKALKEKGQGGKA